MSKENNTQLKGYIVERQAELWLRSRGFEVFYNPAPVGPADLVIWDKTSTPVPVDVKTYKVTFFALKERPDSTQPKVKFLWYCPARGQFAWEAQATLWYKEDAGTTY